MSEKPYYEEKYNSEEEVIPSPTFGQVFKNLFLSPFKWNARSTRKGYWISVGIGVVLSIILTVLIIGTMRLSQSVPALAVILNIIWFALLIWMFLGGLGFTVRRLHDTNHSGWWYWINYVPFGWIVLLYFLLLPSVEKPVKWGSYLFIDKKDEEK